MHLSQPLRPFSSYFLPQLLQGRGSEKAAWWSLASHQLANMSLHLRAPQSWAPLSLPTHRPISSTRGRCPMLHFSSQLDLFPGSLGQVQAPGAHPARPLRSPGSMVSQTLQHSDCSGLIQLEIRGKNHRIKEYPELEETHQDLV